MFNIFKKLYNIISLPYELVGWYSFSETNDDPNDNPFMKEIINV